jgi:predicted RNA-binding Zn-ribbon protein involved in translation (DUF1610 family)
MDYCIDCDRQLQQLVCLSCNIIYSYDEVHENRCDNCHHKMIKPLTKHSKLRYKCNFCNWNYFVYKDFKNTSEHIDEVIRLIVRYCDECETKMEFSNLTGELVCTNCGLIYDRTIII